MWNVLHLPDEMAATLLPDEVAGSVERFEGALTELESSLEPVLRGLTPGRNAYSHVRSHPICIFPLCSTEALVCQLWVETTTLAARETSARTGSPSACGLAPD